MQVPRTFPAEVDVPASDLAAFAGDYESTPGRVVSFFVQQGRLFLASGGPPTALFASGANQFFTKTSNLSVTFAVGPGRELSPTAVWQVDDADLALKRLVRESPSPELVRACAGDFYSAELRTMYTLEVRDGRLLLRYPRGVSELRAINRNTWIAGYPLGIVTMKRSTSGACDALDVTTARVRNLQFQRMPHSVARP